MKKKEEIKVLIKEPGKTVVVTTIPNKLENLQQIVGGYIETVTVATNLVIICNEEGLIHGLPYNCEICGVDFVGTIIICGVKGDEFADLPVSWATMKKHFPQLWEVNA